MTERIDLDELDAGDDDEDAPNPGDWFWREEGDPPDEPEAVTEIKTTNSDTTDSDADANADDSGGDADDSGGDAEARGDAAESSAASPSASESGGSGPMPRVPRENEDKPVGVPTESGGAGGVPAGADASSASASDEAAGASGADAPAADAAKAPDAADAPETSGADATETTAADATDTADAADTANAPKTTAADEHEVTGPHGGGADDMTLAFTYEASTRLSNFGGVAADAYGWADWVGIVGRVPAHVINKFQRDRNVDLDFFNGGGTDPGERLARMGPSSMFYAERMVVVGIEGEDEEIAEKADWEFVPLSDAAEKADWDVIE